MKKIFGIILIIIGVICILPQVFSPSVAGTIGGLIGVSLFTFLPAFLLLQDRKVNKPTNQNGEKDVTTPKASNSSDIERDFNHIRTSSGNQIEIQERLEARKKAEENPQDAYLEWSERFSRTFKRLINSEIICCMIEDVSECDAIIRIKTMLHKDIAIYQNNRDVQSVTGIQMRQYNEMIQSAAEKEFKDIFKDLELN